MALDLPGFNKSEVATEQFLQPSAHTQCVIEVAYHYFGKERKFVIVGHSLGGYVAARVVGGFKSERIEKCVCLMPSGLKMASSLQNMRDTQLSDNELLNTQKCQSIISYAGPEIGDYFY